MHYNWIFFSLTFLLTGQIKQSQTPTVQSQTTILCDSIPPLNLEVLAFVDAKMGKKVGNGECWTLAAEALEITNAKWDRKFKYGQLLDPETDCIYPGDIIQFKGVKFVSKENGAKIIDEMDHHTAIVYKVIGKGHYEIAHQNTQRTKKRVGVSSIDLKYQTKGKMKFYRPTRA
jgi:hypothetical protein